MVYFLRKVMYKAYNYLYMNKENKRKQLTVES